MTKIRFTKKFGTAFPRATSLPIPSRGRGRELPAPFRVKGKIMNDRMNSEEIGEWIDSIMAGRVRQKEQSNLDLPEDMENFFDATTMAFVMVATAPDKEAKRAAQELVNESGALLTGELLKEAALEADRQIRAMN